MDKRDIFVQNKLVKAAQIKAKTLEEAKKRDLGVGCLVKAGLFNYVILYKHSFEDGINYKCQKENDYYTRNFQINDIKEIVGQPPTLSRVLKSLRYVIKISIVNSIIKENTLKVSTYYDNAELFAWKLLNEDGTDATYFDQTEETKEAIAKLLGWKE